MIPYEMRTEEKTNPDQLGPQFGTRRVPLISRALSRLVLPKSPNFVRLIAEQVGEIRAEERFPIRFFAFEDHESH